MAPRMPRGPQDERVRLLAVELAGLQEELEDFQEHEASGTTSGAIRLGRIRSIVARLRAARSRLTATIEEDRA